MKKREKIVLDFSERGGRKVGIWTRVCSNPFSQARGLMFRSRKNSPALVFRFKRPVKEPIHSFFVFFPFAALWIDSDGKIIESKIVRPFSLYICPKKKFFTLVEIPLSTKNRKILDDIEKFK